MEMNFFMPTRIITGKGCIEKNAAVFSKYGKSCLIVTGKTSAKKCGALDDVTNALTSVGISHEIYNGIEQNPTYVSCLEASEKAKSFGAEFIIGIGGGSPLDAAKAVAVLSACRDTSEEALYSMKWDAKPLPIIAVGTTAGTGSEVTPVAVITNSKGLKKSFRTDDTYPSVSFGDPSYTMSLSTVFTRSTALDALCHCVEAYFNRASNEICREFAVRGVQLLMDTLYVTARRDAAELSYEEREELYCASLYGGLAISVAGTCFPHGMGYFLSEQFGIPHGNACAVYLQHFLSHNAKADPDKVDQFVACSGVEIEDLLDMVERNLPKIDVKLTEEKLNELLPRFVDNKNLKKCYGNVDVKMAEEILRDLFM